MYGEETTPRTIDFEDDIDIRAKESYLIRVIPIRTLRQTYR